MCGLAVVGMFSCDVTGTEMSDDEDKLLGYASRVRPIFGGLMLHIIDHFAVYPAEMRCKRGWLTYAQLQRPSEYHSSTTQYQSFRVLMLQVLADTRVPGTQYFSGL